jgi:hypothetical protein
MIHTPDCFSKTILVATLLTIGCTGSGMAGCGSETTTNANGAGPADIDSELVGIYAIDSYQSSPADENGNPVPDSCDQLADISKPNFIVLYGFRPNPEASARLGGVFCSTVEDCQDVARRGPEPTFGYSFIVGNDAAGWTGYAELATRDNGADCVSDMQVHSLSSEGQSITINTDQVQVTYPPEMVPELGDEATCRVGNAISAITPDLPCQARLLLNATRN